MQPYPSVSSSSTFWASLPASEPGFRSDTGTQEKAVQEIKPEETADVILKQHGTQKPGVLLRQLVKKGKWDAFENMKGREMLSFLAWKGVPFYQTIRQKETTEREDYYHCWHLGRQASTGGLSLSVTWEALEEGFIHVCKVSFFFLFPPPPPPPHTHPHP